MARCVTHLVLCACTVWAMACGDDGSAKDASARTSPRPAASSLSPLEDGPAVENASAIEGTFDVRGHGLYIACRGDGSPTVVYFHGYTGSSANAGLLPELLGGRRRVCVYDRANTGRSELIPGPVTGKDSVQDLGALLAAAHVPGPYVLLGASFGGLIATMYAATYPDDVAGMVLLDATLPDAPSVERRFVPKDERLQQADWRGTSERFDRFTTYLQAQAVAGSTPRIPVTYIAASRLDLPPSWPATRITAAIRRTQRTFLDGFAPGRLLVVDTPHYMEPLIPERIAREVERVIRAAAER